MRNWLQGPPIEAFRLFCLVFDEVSTLAGKGKTLSLQEVSRRLQMSASSISLTLKALEDYYGLKNGSLLNRTLTGGCQITGQSRNLYSRARRCVDAHNALRAWTHNIQSGVLRIGCPFIIDTFVVPEVLTRCIAKKSWDAGIDIECNDEQSFLGRIETLRYGNYSLVIDLADPHRFEGVECEILDGFRSLPWLLIPPKELNGPDPFAELRPHDSKNMIDELPLSVNVVSTFPTAVSNNPEVMTRLPEPDRENGYRVTLNSTVSVVHHVRSGSCVGIVYAWKSLLLRWLALYPGMQCRALISTRQQPDALPEYQMATYTVAGRSPKDFELRFLKELRKYAKEGCPQPLPLAVNKSE